MHFRTCSVIFDISFSITVVSFRSSPTCGKSEPRCSYIIVLKNIYRYYFISFYKIRFSCDTFCQFIISHNILLIRIHFVHEQFKAIRKKYLHQFLRLPFSYGCLTCFQLLLSSMCILRVSNKVHELNKKKWFSLSINSTYDNN